MANTKSAPLQAIEVVTTTPLDILLNLFKSETRSPALSPAKISALGKRSFHF
jgi:hypothetical protein